MAEIVISSSSDQSTVGNGFSLLVLCSNNCSFHPFRSYFLYCFCTLSGTIRVRRSFCCPIILPIEIVMTNIFGDSCTVHMMAIGFIGNDDHGKLFILLSFE